MEYFPLFFKTTGHHVLMVGGGGDVVHKLRLMLKTTASLHVFGAITDDAIADWRDAGRLTHHDRAVRLADTVDAAFAYIGVDDPETRDAAMAVFDKAGLPYCVIDDKARSRFITPALVDRDPLVVAIGSEGTGPVIARSIKSRIDAMLPQGTGAVARAAGAFRPHAEVLPKGAARRQFWSRYTDDIAPEILASAEQTPPHDQHNSTLEQALTSSLHQLLKDSLTPASSTGIGATGKARLAKEYARLLPVVVADDPELLTRQAARLIHDADVVISDPGVSPALLELTRRESRRIDVMAGDHHTIDHRAIDHRAMIADVACHLKAGRKLVYLTPTPQPKLDDALLAMAGVAVDVLPYVAPHDVALPYVAPHDVAPPHEGPSYGEMPSPPLDGGFALLPDHAATSPRYMSPRELLPHQKRII